MIGSRIGNYRIEHEIPGGGMGRVFEATQLTLNRSVAIKVLRQELAESEDQVARFRREADTLARLDHESIVRIIDVVEHEGRHLIVMEFVGGPALGDLLIRAGRFPPAFARDVAADIAGALAAAHGKGIIHRDIKPGNILFTTDGRPKLADFGIARVLDAVTGTQSQLVGTPYYMSPEQVKGGVLTPVSDVYALGVVLFEMLSGRVPFSADTPIGVAMKHIQEPPPPLLAVAPDVPAGLGQLIERALEKDPGSRYPDAEAFQEALQRLDLGVPAGRALRRLFPGLARGEGVSTCQRCATPLKPEFLTCPRCGQAVGTPSSPPESAAHAPVPVPSRAAAVPSAGDTGGSRRAPLLPRLAVARGGRPAPTALVAAGVLTLAALGVGVLWRAEPPTQQAGASPADTITLAHHAAASPLRPTVEPVAGGLQIVQPRLLGDDLRGLRGGVSVPEEPPAAPGETARPARPNPAPEPRRAERPAGSGEPSGPTPAVTRDEPAPRPAPLPTPEPGFDEASAAREIDAIIDRQRRATESGDIALLLQDLASGLHRNASRDFRGMHRDASEFSSQITNRVVRFADPDNAQVSFHAVITATRRADRQRITVADLVVVWRLTRSDGRWLIVSVS